VVAWGTEKGGDQVRGNIKIGRYKRPKKAGDARCGKKTESRIGSRGALEKKDANIAERLGQIILKAEVT